MSFWTPESIKSVLNGRWLARPRAGTQLNGLSTDSRSIAPGQAFLALRGERFDGHAFLGLATLAGAGLLIVDNEASAQSGISRGDPGGPGVLLVDDCANALLRLARAYRQSLTGVRVIAVGGSNGKTTTVRMIDALLSRRLRGRASAKSFNNSIGVPLTLLSARAGDQYVVCEVGTNAPGEIGALASIVAPDIVVLTSLGREHLEGLGSIEGVAQEEASLVSGLRQGGSVVVCDDQRLVEGVRARIGNGSGSREGITTFGTSERADVRVTSVKEGVGRVHFTMRDGEEFSVPLSGAHNALNAAAAITVARRLGLSPADIRAGLEEVQGPPMRLERSVVSGVRVLNDAYNANPESVLGALRAFRAFAGEVPGCRRVIVLGDMLELGGHGPRCHAEIGEAIAGERSADLVILVGRLVEHARGVIERALGAESVRILPDVGPPRDAHVAGLLRAGDSVLLKGSRGMGLERIVKALSATGVAAGPGDQAGSRSDQAQKKTPQAGQRV